MTHVGRHLARAVESDHRVGLIPPGAQERLPGISESAKIFANVDVTREPIPIVPTSVCGSQCRA